MTEFTAKTQLLSSFENGKKQAASEEPNTFGFYAVTSGIIHLKSHLFFINHFYILL